MAEAPVVHSAPTPSPHRVFIGNLNFSTSWEALKDICAKEVGEVSFVRIPMRNGRPSGNAIVEFSSAELVDLAIKNLNDIEIDGRRIYVKVDNPPPRYQAGAAHAEGGARPAYVPRPPRQPRAPVEGAEGGRKKIAGEDNTSIFLSGLPFSASWQDLKDLCRPYGSVEYADVFTNPDRTSRGVGVVRFTMQEAVEPAIQALNDSDFRGRIIHVRRYVPRAPAGGAEAAAPAAAAPAAEPAAATPVVDAE